MLWQDLKDKLPSNGNVKIQLQDGRVFIYPSSLIQLDPSCSCFAIPMTEEDGTPSRLRFGKNKGKICYIWMACVHVESVEAVA